MSSRAAADDGRESDSKSAAGGGFRRHRNHRPHVTLTRRIERQPIGRATDPNAAVLGIVHTERRIPSVSRPSTGLTLDGVNSSFSSRGSLRKPSWRPW